MIDRILIYFANSKIGSKIKFDKFLNDIPDEYFLEKYNIKRNAINSAIILISLIITIFVTTTLFFYEPFFGFLVFIVIFLANILFLIRNIRKKYLNRILEVEQYSDLICNEILLILSATNSIQLVFGYISQGSYPVISSIAKELMKKLNIGFPPAELFIFLAKNQPSETIKEFIYEIIIPVINGNLELKSTTNYETQWRIRNIFDSYLAQIEGKISIFLAITTIIPIVISMLLVFLGHINLPLIILLPLLFFVFDLIAVEIFNSGKIHLLGG